MVFLQSRVLLCFLRSKATTRNLISRNVSNKPPLSFCFKMGIVDDKWLNEILKRRREENDVKPDSTGYVDNLEDHVSVNTDVNNKNNSNIIEISDNSQHEDLIAFLEKNKHKCNNTLEDINVPGPFDVCTEDLSHLGPCIEPTYNFAAFADKSYTIQQLVKLGVDLHKIEKQREAVELLLSLDFDKDVKPYLTFLNNCGVIATNFGKFITKYPTIFKVDMDDLHTRIRYLRAHSFTPEMIQSILNRNPLWMSLSTKVLDYRLGYFQHVFQLNGHKIRLLSLHTPKLVTYNWDHVKTSTFVIKEEMGFNLEEMQLLLLNRGRLWLGGRGKIIQSFNYAHNEMNLSHKILSRQSEILVCRMCRLEQRHRFLVELKKNQYDPLKPLYVSPAAVVAGTDVEFCKNVAKSSIQTYNMFLKSM
ncbi:transcription termination factor 3, mitochondrial [Colletes gigas]|uniref:transcription termination factor 3, mitochondrial n=1 Tax=Colletes gigas TaxID=935657 RepID=UPI001C9AC67A|nr:transcription termination factor 3, mitochondrial [Colletes gigas]